MTRVSSPRAALDLPHSPFLHQPGIRRRAERNPGSQERDLAWRAGSAGKSPPVA